MTTSFKPVSVAIGDLTAHPANVRSNSPETYDPENIAHLKASISVLGLLQPLLVQKLDGKYAVLAGGRRHAALKELIADKATKGFTAKTKVDCRLVPEDCDVTTALSLAENITQAPMNAIDEFEAFARMMEVDGQTPETIAKTFGTTVAAVKGRLRYGLIHPDIRAAARGKVITLDTMKAFAEHPSQEAQREVYEALTKEDSYLQAYTVRQALISRGVQVSDDIGAFVREDYEARGGAIAADLLEEHSVLEDAALVETILLEKLRAAAEQARAKLGFAWADAMVRYDYATIRLATDGHSIRVFVRRASDYLIGGTYEVPSGLGGTFRVILKDACDTFAIVQNCGNCEDFDAMQPYRVPLDALMEIDDRRAA
jgi:ParB family chromosome partitioning protein